MSVEEMKKQIVEKVVIMDDEKALQQVLNIITGENKAPQMIDATKHADYLFNKHDGLLKRLA